MSLSAVDPGRRGSAAGGSARSHCLHNLCSSGGTFKHIHIAPHFTQRCSSGAGGDGSDSDSSCNAVGSLPGIGSAGRSASFIRSACTAVDNCAISASASSSFCCCHGTLSSGTAAARVIWSCWPAVVAGSASRRSLDFGPKGRRTCLGFRHTEHTFFSLEPLK